MINIKFHLSDQQLKIIIKNLFRLNRVNFGSIYIQVSRGVADRNHSYFGLNSKPVLTMIVSKKKNNISDDIKGVKAITMVDNRWSSQILRQLNYYQMFWLKPMLIKKCL